MLCPYKTVQDGEMNSLLQKRRRPPIGRFIPQNPRDGEELAFPGRYAAIFEGVKTFLGSGWRGLLAPMPVTQCRELKDRRHAGQPASDKENAVGVNETVRGAEPFDRSTGKSLQDLSQPGIG